MGVTDIALDRAYLAAIWLETLFYGMSFFGWEVFPDPELLIGMNIVLFSSCMYVLIARRRTPRVNKYLIGIAIAMFCFSTCHVFLGFYRLIMGFIVLRDQPGGPTAFFSDVSIPANVAKVGLHTVNVSCPQSSCYAELSSAVRCCSPLSETRSLFVPLTSSLRRALLTV